MLSILDMSHSQHVFDQSNELKHSAHLVDKRDRLLKSKSMMNVSYYPCKGSKPYPPLYFVLLLPVVAQSVPLSSNNSLFLCLVLCFLSIKKLEFMVLVQQKSLICCLNYPSWFLPTNWQKHWLIAWSEEGFEIEHELHCQWHITQGIFFQFHKVAYGAAPMWDADLLNSFLHCVKLGDFQVG